MHYINKLAYYLVIILIILSINFFLPRAMPGDPLAYVLGENPDMPIRMTEEEREMKLAEYGLDKPLPEQYVDYMIKLSKGDLGHSIYYKNPVMDEILIRLKWTLLLTGTATVIYMPLGIFLGAESAWARGKKKDTLSLITILTVSSFPSFVLGTLFVIFFAFKLGLFPLGCANTIGATYANPLEEALDILHHLILPVATLIIAHIGGTYLLMRNSMLSVIGADYILSARAKGLSERYILNRHAIRNALLPIVTMAALTIGFMTVGTIFVEKVFAYPGIGLLLYDSVLRRDYPLIQGIFLFISIFVVLANFIADMAYVWLDPRVSDE
ncbi:MAG: ABC transporter permease [Methanosarcinales archaeon]|nr:MAG: ABC transporter permease [Methanosarcinales archaeon]